MVFVVEIDPMSALRDDAKATVARHYNREAAATAHQDAAYAGKRAAAASVLAGQVSAQLIAEAMLRGVDVATLAQDILSKPDTVAEREGRRQAVLAAIRAASTPLELQQVMAIYG